MKRLMKRWMVYPILALGCLFGATACGDDDEPATEPAAKAEFKLDAESVSVAADGGNSSITYTLKNAGANSSISVTSDKEWVSNIKTNAANKITFDVAANTLAEAREAKVSVVYSDDTNEDIKTSFSIKQAAADLDFVFAIGETGSSWVQLSMTPKDNNMRYSLAALPTEAMDGYVSDEAYFEKEMSDYQDVADMFGLSLGEVLDILFMKGAIKDGYITTLEPETEYYVFCYGINDDNELATPIIKQKVKTPAAVSVDNTITINFTKKSARSVILDVTTTTPDSYVLVYAETEFINSLTDNELREELLNEGYPVEAGDKEDQEFKNLSPNTEYTFVAMGRAGGVATTGIVKATCTTEDAQKANITYSLPDKKYFDAMEVKDKYPSLFPAGVEVTEAHGIIVANIKADGAKGIYTVIYSQEAIDKQEAQLGRKLTEEEYITLATNNGNNGNKVLMVAPYDLPLFLIGVATDEAGNPGQVYTESMTVTKAAIAPVEEFDAYLASRRIMKSVLPVTNASSMKGLLMKNNENGSKLKSMPVKALRSQLIK